MLHIRTLLETPDRGLEVCALPPPDTTSCCLDTCSTLALSSSLLNSSASISLCCEVLRRLAACSFTCITLRSIASFSSSLYNEGNVISHRVTPSLHLTTYTVCTPPPPPQLTFTALARTLLVSSSVSILLLVRLCACSSAILTRSASIWAVCSASIYTQHIQ